MSIFRNEHVPAVITGLAAVLAAGVAGYWPADASKDAAKEETKQAAQRLDEDAKGSARVLVNELLIAGHEIADLAGDGYMHSFGPRFRVEIRESSLSLVAARLTTTEWTEVNHALSDAESLERYISQRSHPSHALSRMPLSKHTVDVLADDLASLNEESTELAALANLDPPAFPTFDKRAINELIRIRARNAGVRVPD